MVRQLVSRALTQVPWSEEFEDPILARFKAAIQEFEEHYRPLAQTSLPYTSIKSDIQKAVIVAAKEKDIRLSALQFRDLMVETMKAYDTKQKAREKHWTGKIIKFASKMYPLICFTLHIVGAVSQVWPKLVSIS
jgi:hypothetical protein